MCASTLPRHPTLWPLCRAPPGLCRSDNLPFTYSRLKRRRHDRIPRKQRRALSRSKKARRKRSKRRRPILALMSAMRWRAGADGAAEAIKRAPLRRHAHWQQRLSHPRALSLGCTLLRLRGPLRPRAVRLRVAANAILNEAWARWQLSAHCACCELERRYCPRLYTAIAHADSIRIQPGFLTRVADVGAANAACMRAAIPRATR